jgi:hypothetical protein
VTVFVEVVRPDRSDMDKDAHERVTRARERLGQRDGLHVIVELLTFPSDEIVETVRRAMDGSPLGQWFEMPGAARWRLDEHPQGGRSGEFKWPANEHRAHRLISDEYGHFAADVPYVLAVDTNATLLSPEGWSEAFVRCFQPLRNRRLGATIAYREYSLAAADPLRTLACLRINPHATRQIPVELVRLLEALHQQIAVSAA